MAYQPIRDILKFYFDVKEGDREHLIKKKMKAKAIQLNDEFKEALAAFHELLSLQVTDEVYLQLDPQQKRVRTFESLRDLFIRESLKKPLVLVVEDLHWIDKTSAEFLNYLIDWLAKTHILLILLYRPEYTHQWGSKSYYNKIGLDQLSPKDSAELVQYILKGAEIEPELRKFILRRTGGNPLFIEEFTHDLLAEIYGWFTEGFDTKYLKEAKALLEELM